MVPALRMERVVKHFGGVVALDGAGLEVRRGEVHALLGENGAGKTTLMSVLYGLIRPDAGRIELDGEPVSPRSPADAIARGIGMVHQHPLLVGPLSVAENLCLGGCGDGTAEGMRRALGGVVETFPLDVDPRSPVESLPMSLRQRVEIARCLAHGVRLLILDEPTAVLTPEEVAGLFREVRQLAAGGRSVVLITHRLAEVGAVAGRVTVLRRGRAAGTFEAGRVSAAELARHMVGAPSPALPRQVGEAVPRGARGPRLELDRCTVFDRFGRRTLDEVTLRVRAGEIVCLAGVEGNGQRPLAEVLFGLRRPSSGEVRLEGRPLPIAERWRARGIAVARIPEDRRGEGLVLDAPLWRNLLLGPMAPPLPLLLRRRRVLLWAQEQLRANGVVPADPLAPAGTLSGGNQQKVVLARELAGRPRAVVAVNPTRGLDIGAQRDVHARLEALRDDGIGVLLISTDLDEVERLGDRVGVLSGGRLHGPYPRGQLDRGRLGLLMAGLPAPSEPSASGVSR